MMKFIIVLHLIQFILGTGGYRLGRVDQSIVREPGTNIPKIPGSSISGVTRAYSAMAENRYLMEKEDEKGNKKTYSCAGQGGHCGKHDCPICVTFGFAKGEGGNEGTGFQGLALFSDARILFFPVYSYIGPVWITCPSVLKEHGFTDNQLTLDEEKIRITNYLNVNGNKINLGWLMFETQNNFEIPDTLI